MNIEIIDILNEYQIFNWKRIAGAWVAYAAGAPARRALLAEGRCFVEWALARSVMLTAPGCPESRFRAHPGGAWWGVSRTEQRQILIGGS